MSLMGMQLWTLGGVGPALVVVLAVQTIAAVLSAFFIDIANAVAIGFMTR